MQRKALRRDADYSRQSAAKQRSAKAARLALLRRAWQVY